MRIESFPYNRGFTHGGKFHADDVLATALLKYINPEFTVMRGFDIPDCFDGIVYDIGRGAFDHHQEDKAVRENGVPYAAFGLVWRAFGPQLVGEEEAKRFDRTFIENLDLSDNTGSKSELADVIDDFNPGWDSEEDRDEAFGRAVDFALVILKNRFRSIEGFERAKEIVDQAIADSNGGELVVLPRYAPWKDRMVHSNALLCVYPSTRGGYGVQGVPVAEGSLELRAELPKELRGKEPEELQKLTGIETITFVHASGFMGSTKTLEDALKLAELTLEKRSNS